MTERSITVRSGIGCAAHVIQVRPLLVRNINVDDPTIILIRHGTKRIRWSGNELYLQAGEVVIIGSGESFDVINTPGENGRYEADWLSFNPDLVSRYVCRNQHCLPVSDARKLKITSDSFRRAFYHTTEIFRDLSAIPQSVAIGRMQEMLSWLDEYGICFGNFQRSGVERKVRKLVSSDASHSWSTKSVANQMGMSEATLRRKLRAENTSFSRLLVDVRMCRALTLLQVTDLSVTQIAFEVGYESPSKFSARFRNRFGFCPGQVRTECRPATATQGLTRMFS